MTLNSYRNIIIGIVIIVVHFLLYLVFPRKDRLTNYHSKQHYNGIVKYKYIDKPNHACETIVFEDSSKMLLPGGSYLLYDSIQAGDSLYKEEGSLKGYILRDSQIIHIYMKRGKTPILTFARTIDIGLKINQLSNFNFSGFYPVRSIIDYNLSIPK